MRMKWTAAFVALVIAGALMGVGCIQNEEGTRAAESAVYVKVLPPATMLDALKSGDVDGFVGWSPFDAQAVVSGYGVRLLNSSEVWPNHPCCILAASESYTDERVLTALVWAHIKATEFINDPANHDKVVQYVMEFMGFDRDVAEAALPTVKFVEYPDVEEFRNYYYRLKEAGLLESTPEELGYGSEDAFFDDFLTDEYYRAVKEKLDANPNWVPEKVSPNEVVRIAYLPSDHHLALYVAQKEGYYEQVGLVSGENLEIKPPFANGVAIMEAFKNGEIDVGYLGGAPATLKRINDDVKIRIIAGANNEGSSIVVGAQSGINTPAQLAGKTIATPGFGTVQDFILRQLAEENGLRVVLK